MINHAIIRLRPLYTAAVANNNIHHVSRHHYEGVDGLGLPVSLLSHGYTTLIIFLLGVEFATWFDFDANTIKEE